MIASDAYPDSIPSCPHAVLAANDRLRVSSMAQTGPGDGPGLWSLDALLATDQLARLRESGPGVLTLRHSDDRTTGEPPTLTQAGYSARFAAEFPEIASILPIEHVVVAGGAAAWAITGNAKAGDIDLFIVGLRPDVDNSRATVAFWAKVDEVCSRIRRALHEWDQVMESCAPGLISFNAMRHPGAPPLQIQLILRTFPSVSALLHSFDVSSCCVAYDGCTAWMTGLAAWAHAHRVNLINPVYRSPTYERRLLKYFERGFALGLLHMSRAVMDDATQPVHPMNEVWAYYVREKRFYIPQGGQIILKRLALHVNTRVQGTVAVAPADEFQGRAVEVTTDISDDRLTYTSISSAIYAAFCSSVDEVIQTCIVHSDEAVASLLESGTDDAAAKAAACVNLGLLGKGRVPSAVCQLFAPNSPAGWKGATDYRLFAMSPPTPEEVFPRAAFCKALDQWVRRTEAEFNPTRPSAGRTSRLIQYYGRLCHCTSLSLTTDEQEVLQCGGPGRDQLLDRAIDRFHALYEAMPDGIEWCQPATTTVDGSPSVLAGFCPQPETPAEWYGRHAYVGALL